MSVVNIQRYLLTLNLRNKFRLTDIIIILDTFMIMSPMKWHILFLKFGEKKGHFILGLYTFRNQCFRWEYVR